MSPHLQTLLQFFSLIGWIALLPILEKLWPIYPQPFLRWGLISDVIYTYQNHFLQIVTLAASPVILESLVALAFYTHFFDPTGQAFLQNALLDQPLWLNLLVLIITGETAFYIVHYYFHKVPILWEFHKVHHSSTLLDSFSTSRFHILERIAFSAPNIFAIIYLGATPTALLIYFFFRAFMDRYIHSNLNGPRWTHKFMISSPHFHRWHHATDREAWDTNFSGNFIFLDILFGTAYDPPPEQKPAPREFGDPHYTNNFILHQIQPFIGLYQRFKRHFKTTEKPAT